MVSFDPTWSAGYIDQGQFKKGTIPITKCKGNDRLSHAV
jgi:hypothetical protein